MKVILMKKLFLIAALFLATGAAHAEPPPGEAQCARQHPKYDNAYDLCLKRARNVAPIPEDNDVFNDLGITMFDCKDVLVQRVHLSDMETYRIEISVEHKSRKRPPIITFDAKKETLTVNGTRCKEAKNQ